MAPSVTSYGSTKGVAALVPKWASGTGDAADFSAATRPTLLQVESFIDAVSGILNSMLAEAGFHTPVAHISAAAALSYFVNEEVASIAEGINGSGRFGPTAKSIGARGRFALMLDDVKAFIEGNKAGFERLDVVRDFEATSSIGYRDSDNAGRSVAPIFQRNAFGNTFKDWDGGGDGS